jgi:hypothetical protein
MKKIRRIPRVTSVTVVPPYGLRLTFDDGIERTVDLAGDLWGPKFEPLKILITSPRLPRTMARLCGLMGSTWTRSFSTATLIRRNVRNMPESVAGDSGITKGRLDLRVALF